MQSSMNMPESASDTPINTDADMMVRWQQTNDPALFSQMVIRYQPVINSVVNKYKTVGVSPATLRAKATSQMIKAFKTYDPSRNTQPVTHIWNNLQKVQRIAGESLMSGHIPEHRNLKKSNFMIARDNLADRLGYEPSVDEMSDELGWNKKETARMFEEIQGGETTASNAEFDFYGQSTQMESKDKILVDYLYHQLSGPEKVVLEHTMGYGGKQILNNKQLAQKLNVNEMAISRMKKKLGSRIREARL